MATALPPVPLKDINRLPYSFQEWLRKIQTILNTAGIAWTLIDFTGSDLADIETRNHNDLENIQGGAAADYYHLTGTQATDLTDGGTTTLHTHTASTISGFTEEAQDAVGGILVDTATIDLTYNDGTPSITASVVAGSIGPTQLEATTVTPASYTNTNLTVDADGRITSASNGTAPGNAFGTIVVSGQSDIVADSTSDTLTIAAGSNITLTTNAGTDTLTIAASGSGSGVPAGTSNPGGPSTGDQYFRTDLGLYIYYNGTRWLTVQQYVFTIPAYALLPTGRSATQSGLLATIPGFMPDYDLWIETFRCVTWVGSANTGSAYWTIALQSFNLTGTGTTIASFSTGTTPDANANYIQHNVTVNALLGSSIPLVGVTITKTSTPGTLEVPGAAMIGRLVVT